MKRNLPKMLDMKNATFMPSGVIHAIANAWVRAHFGENTTGGIWYDRDSWGIKIHTGRLFGESERQTWNALLDRYDPDHLKHRQENVRMDAYCVYHVPCWMSFAIFDEYVRNEISDIERLIVSYPVTDSGVVFMLEPKTPVSNTKPETKG